MEAGLAFQSMLLLRRRQLTVLIHPLGKRYTSPGMGARGKIALGGPQRRSFGNSRAGRGKRRLWRAPLHRRRGLLREGHLGVTYRMLEFLLLRDQRNCRAAAKYQHPGDQDAGTRLDSPSKAPRT